jgi:hypothetical protein
MTGQANAAMLSDRPPLCDRWSRAPWCAGAFVVQCVVQRDECWVSCWSACLMTGFLPADGIEELDRRPEAGIGRGDGEALLAGVEPVRGLRPTEGG